MVTQGYWEQFYTVGVTYQTENQPTETTVMANGGFVDVSSYNLIGHHTRMDWAVHTYETPANASLGPTNGGIVGEIVATTTRNELDPRFQAIESYEPGPARRDSAPLRAGEVRPDRPDDDPRRHASARRRRRPSGRLTT